MLFTGFFWRRSDSKRFCEVGWLVLFFGLVTIMKVIFCVLFLSFVVIWCSLGVIFIGYFCGSERALFAEGCGISSLRSVSLGF